MNDDTILESVAGNPENQDCGAIITSGPRQVLIIADGAGGLSGGVEAANLAVKYIRERAELLNGPASCVSILQKMDQEIAQNQDAGETTCSFTVVSDKQVFGASVGDSGVWVIGETGFKNLTENQSRKPLIGSGSARPVAFNQTRVCGEYLLLATDGLLKYAPAERIISTCRKSVAETAVKNLIQLVRYPSGALPDDVTVILTKL
jgi:serine/threonine protein phosphatase PrpC